MSHSSKIADIEASITSDWLLKPVSVSDTASWKQPFLKAINNNGACIAITDTESVADFKKIIEDLGISTAPNYSDLPNIENKPNIFETTPYPHYEAILFHNEASHMPISPKYIFFYCQTAAISGGSTPLSDGKLAFELLSKEIQTLLLDKDLTYYRRFIPDIDISWQSYFGSNSLEEVKAYCEANNMQFKYYDNGIIETSFKTSGIQYFPNLGHVMFHQIALFHPAFLNEDVKEYFEVNTGLLPRMVTFADGDKIPDAWAREIHEAQIKASKVFKWQSGYILGIDNRRMAHARAPYDGERKHFVILSELVKKKELWE